MGFLDSVKDIAGKVGGSVEKGAKTVSESSKKLAEKTRLKREIAHIETLINDDYIELGRAYFDIICDDPENEYAATVSDIEENNENLQQLRAQLMALEDKICCENCGSQVRKEQVYCDKCGTKLDTQTDLT